MRAGGARVHSMSNEAGDSYTDTYERAYCQV
jgi:hypothetical protein